MRSPIQSGWLKRPDRANNPPAEQALKLRFQLELVEDYLVEQAGIKSNVIWPPNPALPPHRAVVRLQADGLPKELNGSFSCSFDPSRLDVGSC